VNLPLPEKWFTAEELSIRAEPLGDVQMTYPPELAAKAQAGQVRLLLYIDERGVVHKAQIHASAPEGVFDEIALKAWRDVRFSPARKDGVAVKSQKLLEISFAP
jgi:protein TonB